MADIIITSPTTFFIDKSLWSINRFIAVRETFGCDTSRYDTHIYHAGQIHQLSNIEEPNDTAYSSLHPVLMNISCQTIQSFSPWKGPGMTLSDYYSWADHFINYNGFAIDKKISDLIKSSSITVWSILDTQNQAQYPMLRDPSSYLLLQVTADEDTVLLAKLSLESMTINLDE